MNLSLAIGWVVALSNQDHATRRMKVLLRIAYLFLGTRLGFALPWQWGWENGVYPPGKAYIDKFFNRTIDLINKYGPDVVYFDDSQLPLFP